MINRPGNQKSVFQIIIWFGIAAVAGILIGYLTSPGDYPWYLKIIGGLWILVLLLHLILSKEHKNPSSENSSYAKVSAPPINSDKHLNSDTENLEFAKVWDHKTAPEGYFIGKNEFEDLVKDKSEYFIFLVDNGEFKLGTVGEAYFYNNPVFRQSKARGSNKEKTHLTPLEYRILFHTLQNNGVAGNFFVLIARCWNEPDRAEDLKKQKENGYDINGELSKYRKGVKKLNNILKNHFGIELSTSQTGIYRLSSTTKFCIVQLKNTP